MVLFIHNGKGAREAPFCVSGENHDPHQEKSNGSKKYKSAYQGELWKLAFGIAAFLLCSSQLFSGELAFFILQAR